MTDKNFPGIVPALANEYSELAFMNFVMNFYNFYECIEEGENLSESDKKLVSEICRATKGLYDSEFISDDGIAVLEPVRNKLMAMMDELTAYADSFQIHEYLLNRKEYSFKENLPEINDDDEARRILQFLFDSDDNTTVNLRIQQMVSQMPVRMTTTKFLDLLKDAVSVYKGAERNSLNGFIYIIRSAAGIYKSESKVFSDLEGYLADFDNVTYKDMPEDVCYEYASKLEAVSGLLNDRSDLYMSMTDVVNALYAIYLVKPYVTEEIKAFSTAKVLLDSIVDGITDGSFNEIDYSISDEIFASFEGKPEKLAEKIAVNEGRLDPAREDIEKVSAKAYIDLVMASKLMSTSAFAALDDVVDTTINTQEMIDTATDSIMREFSEVLGAAQLSKRRAIMASVLKELPVFFVSHNEVMDYVRFTLSSCHDNAEKSASIEMFWEAMK